MEDDGGQGGGTPGGSPCLSRRTVLHPKLTLTEVLGPDTVFSPRAPMGASHLLRGRSTTAGRDAVTGAMLGVADATQILCSRSCPTPEGLVLLEEAGIDIAPGFLTYVSEEDYAWQLRALTDAGRQVCVTHYHPREQLPHGGWWIPPGLLTRLNDKANLHRLAPPEFCPAREIVCASDLTRALVNRMPPYVLKVCTHFSTASGMAVRVIDSPTAAIRALQELVTGEPVVIEAFHEFDRTLCLNFATNGRDITYLGSAEQILDGTAYIGSWLEARDTVPTEAVEAGYAIMESARQQGYVGFAGFDVGLSAADAPRIFDLNFRQCGSTVPLLFRESLLDAAPRTSCIGTAKLAGPPGLASLGVLRAATHAGAIVPYACYLPEDASGGQSSVVSVLLPGPDRAGIMATLSRMAECGWR